jgi:hypothetical protein
MPQIKITAAGRDALQSNGSDLDDRIRLLVEIVSRVTEIDHDNLCEIATELEENFGSVAAAIKAVRTGEVQF